MFKAKSSKKKAWGEGGKKEAAETLSHGQPSMHPLNSFKIRGFQALRLASSDLSFKRKKLNRLLFTLIYVTI